MRARVLRVHRRIDQRHPVRVGFGGVVAVAIAIADGGHRTPELVVVLGVEHGDGRIVHGLGDGHQQARVARGIAPGPFGHRIHHAVIDRRKRGFPESGLLQLRRRALRAVASAQRLDLVVIARPGDAVQRRRRHRPELRRRGHQPGSALGPLGNGGQDGRHVDARAGHGPVALRCQRAIVLAERQHRGRRARAQGDAVALALAFGHGGERVAVRGLDRFGLLRQQFHQRRAVGRRHRRLHGGAGDMRRRQRIGGIAPGDGVDRFVHGGLHQRHDAVGHGCPRLGLGHDPGGRAIPVRDHVGAGFGGRKRQHHRQRESTCLQKPDHARPPHRD